MSPSTNNAALPNHLHCALLMRSKACLLTIYESKANKLTFHSTFVFECSRNFFKMGWQPSVPQKFFITKNVIVIPQCVTPNFYEKSSTFLFCRTKYK